MSSAGKTYSVPSRDNNINFLRFIAASLVIWFHMASLLVIPEPYIMGQGLGPIAVNIFFVLSGYLIAKSWTRSSSFGSYLIRRIARIFPGLAVVKASDEVPAAFCSEEGTIGLRMPANETARALIGELGCPLATTSANISGQKNTIAFNEIDPAIFAAVGAALSDEEPKSGIASTIVNCALGDHPVLVREGAITVADIRALS